MGRVPLNIVEEINQQENTAGMTKAQLLAQLKKIENEEKAAKRATVTEKKESNVREIVYETIMLITMIGILTGIWAIWYVLAFVKTI